MSRLRAIWGDKERVYFSTEEPGCQWPDVAAAKSFGRKIAKWFIWTLLSVRRNQWATKYDQKHWTESKYKLDTIRVTSESKWKQAKGRKYDETKKTKQEKLERKTNCYADIWSYTMPGARNPGRATSMRSCWGVFTDQFILRTVLALLSLQLAVNNSPQGLRSRDGRVGPCPPPATSWAHFPGTEQAITDVYILKSSTC